ncbi:MAG: oligosaccharide flippase family protein [Oscillospiraceae bacterium]|jgi:stage V sporulation protein B|nr:oligosaccharide flippase family protein [Oscillospiraceae bacterium]
MKDTVILTVIQVTLQGLALLFNLFISKQLGGAAIGIATLISTFYGLAAVISTGNIFLSASRLISEERGKDGNPERILRYALMYGLFFGTLAGAAVFIFAPFFGETILKNPYTVTAIRIIGCSLPLTSLCGCIKGYFHARRRILIPSCADTLGFFIRCGICALLAVFYVKTGEMSIFTAISVSILAAVAAESVLLIISVLYARERNKQKPTITFPQFIKATVPITLNSYIISGLSSLNEALLPLTLIQFGYNADEALTKFGIFEAIVLPVLFFPAAVLYCFSSILVPEIARECACDKSCISDLLHKSLSRTMAYSFFVMAVMLTFGRQIGDLLSGNDNFTGELIVILTFVIPFIYLEITLEGILKGLGKHNFSTVNYLAEYIIRISVLLILVPVIGFYGVIVSYFTSNIVCNISRIIQIKKETSFSFKFQSMFMIPIFSTMFSWLLVHLLWELLNLEKLSLFINMGAYIFLMAGVYCFIYKLIPGHQPSKSA